MGVVAGVAMVAGAVISGAGQYQAGKTNEAIAKHNAQLGRLRAKDSLERGQKLAVETKQEFRRLQSEQDVGFATQNVQLGVGVSAVVRAETEMAAETASKQVLNNAAVEAWGFEQGAQESILSGQLAASAGRFGGAGTLLSGIGSGIAVAQTPEAPGTSSAPAASFQQRQPRVQGGRR
jgi:hypothetical protein